MSLNYRAMSADSVELAAPGILRQALSDTPAWQAQLKYAADPELVRACLTGSEAAWQQLVERYGALVYSIPRRLGLSAHDADDIFQNVFMVVVRRLDSLQNQQCLAAWLITITRRECLHFCKRSPEYAELAEEITDGGPFLSDQVEYWELQHLIQVAIAQLEPAGQQLLRALFLEEPTPSYEKVADRLGMAVGSIGPARARYLRKLENVLASMGAEIDL